MPIVLTQNEVVVSGLHYANQTGVVYHFPQIYRSKIQRGVEFIYYRGSRRSDGTRRPPEYFGYGRIGEVWSDHTTISNSTRDQRWFAEITDYRPFISAVAAACNGGYLEPAGGRRYWTRSVRQIAQQLYSQIVQWGLDTSKLEISGIESVNIPSPAERHLTQEKLNGSAIGSGNSIGSRRNRAAALVGLRGEEIAWRALLAIPGSSGHSWDAQNGSFPGYDMSYIDASGALHGVEVKSSVGDDISGVELTANEWDCAKRLRERYHLWLVAKCMSNNPEISTITDPFLKCGFSAQPTVWRISTV